MSTEITIQDRPYLLTGHGAAFVLSAHETRRLIAASPDAKVDSGGYRVALTASDGTRHYIIPATLGGGIPFAIPPSIHFGRDWAGRLMACTIPGSHRGRKHVGSHGGTLRLER